MRLNDLLDAFDALDGMLGVGFQGRSRHLAQECHLISPHPVFQIVVEALVVVVIRSQGCAFHNGSGENAARPRVRQDLGMHERIRLSIYGPTGGTRDPGG